MQIRIAEEADLPKLEWCGAFTHHRAIIQEAFALQQRGEALMLVADRNGFPVGQAWMDFRPEPGRVVPKVWAVRVLPECRGSGIGSRLMRELERCAWRKGCVELQLFVEKSNAQARRFYERLGWRIIGERSDSYSYVTPAGVRERVPQELWVFAKFRPPAPA
ncbi:MAG: GNAT family N-acetyltransferase [Steroidobacteraceae bacterium]|nr:GNAT family N-acetyltransferase [Steroidobacteraceae bacterium]